MSDQTSEQAPSSKHGPRLRGGIARAGAALMTLTTGLTADTTTRNTPLAPETPIPVVTTIMHHERNNITDVEMIDTIHRQFYIDVVQPSAATRELDNFLDPSIIQWLRSYADNRLLTKKDRVELSVIPWTHEELQLILQTLRTLPPYYFYYGKRSSMPNDLTGPTLVKADIRYHATDLPEDESGNIGKALGFYFGESPEYIMYNPARAKPIGFPNRFGLETTPEQLIVNVVTHELTHNAQSAQSEAQMRRQQDVFRSIGFAVDYNSGEYDQIERQMRDLLLKNGHITVQNGVEKKETYWGYLSDPNEFIALVAGVYASNSKDEFVDAFKPVFGKERALLLYNGVRTHLFQGKSVAPLGPPSVDAENPPSDSSTAQ